MRLFPQTECDQAVAGRDRDILLAANLVRDACGRCFASHGDLPQERAGSRVERVEIPLAAADEQQVGCAVVRMPLVVTSCILNPHFFIPVWGPMALTSPYGPPSSFHVLTGLRFMPGNPGVSP